MPNTMANVINELIYNYISIMQNFKHIGTLKYVNVIVTLKYMNVIVTFKIIKGESLWCKMKEEK